MALSPAAIQRDVARAYLLTPPPYDDDDNDHRTSNTRTTTTLHGKCFLKVRDELDQVRSDLDRLQMAGARDYDTPPARSSPSYQSWYDDFHGRLDDVKESVGRLEDTVDHMDTTVTEVESGVRDLQENVATLFNRMDDMEDMLQEQRKEIQSLQTSMAELRVMFGELQATQQEQREQIQLLENISVLYRNGMVTRFHDLVTPLSIPTGKGYVLQQQEQRKLKWYWNLHKEDQTEQLIQQLEHYQIQLSYWLRIDVDTSDDDSDDSDNDNLDLDRGVPLPDNPRVAILRYRDRAVKALFIRLGLSYQHFKDMKQLGRVQAPVKRSRTSTPHQAMERSVRQRGVSKSTMSDLGSTTHAFTSPTQSGVS